MLSTMCIDRVHWMSTVRQFIWERLFESTNYSSRKMRVLAHFTIHMVEIIQLYTYQPRMWLGFRYHPCSNHMYGWAQSQIHGIIRNEPQCG